MMTNPRKKIILNEILFWKQNKLLPEHYCDFLATLYAEGNDIEEIESATHKQAVLPLEKRKMMFFIVGLCLGMMVLLYVYFTVTSLLLFLTGIVAIAAITLFIIAFRFASKNNFLAPALHIIAAILLFSLSIRMYTTYFSGNNIALFAFIAANCAVWLFSGLKMKLLYFTVSGVLGLVALIGYYLYNFM
ncbi:hypothetical protein ACIQXW_10975 [Lysinibacillus sp. NPDC097162]|uniref:hypothetical protein n=2 Tax=Lysinibacillus TaxID=400634 RepID=UPI00381527C0